MTTKNIGADPHKWPLNKLTANGLSSSRRICKKYDTVRCRHRNRRVEFRIQVKEIQKNITDLVANLKISDQEQNKKNGSLSQPISKEKKGVGNKR